MAALALLPRAVGPSTAASLLPAGLYGRVRAHSSATETSSPCSGLVAASGLHGSKLRLHLHRDALRVPNGGQRWNRVCRESSLLIRARVAWTEDLPPSCDGARFSDDKRQIQPHHGQAAVHTHLPQAESQHSTLGSMFVFAQPGKSFAVHSAPQVKSSQDHLPPPATLERARLLALVGIALGVVAVASPALATVATAAAGTTVPRTRAIGRALQVLAGTELLASAWTGLVAGCLHTLTGPDHLAALAPLSIGRSKLESAYVGALWGFGHDTGQVLFGLMFLLLKDRLRMDLLQTWGARVVGMTLIGIGLLGLKESQALSVQEEVMSSSTGAAAAEMAVAGVGTGAGGVVELKGMTGQTAKKSVNLATTFATGIIHGLQPDALLMVLPALALPSKMAGAAFLLMFLLGTVAAMGSYTAFIGASSRALGRRIPWVTQRLSLMSSILAMLVGTSILIPGGLSTFLPFVNV